MPYFDSFLPTSEDLRETRVGTPLRVHFAALRSISRRSWSTVEGMPLPAFSSPQRAKQALGIRRRSKQMRRFHQTVQFLGGNEGDIGRTAPPHNHNFLVGSHLVQHLAKLSRKRV